MDKYWYSEKTARVAHLVDDYYGDDWGPCLFVHQVYVVPVSGNCYKVNHFEILEQDVDDPVEAVGVLARYGSDWRYVSSFDEAVEAVTFVVALPEVV